MYSRFQAWKNRLVMSESGFKPSCFQRPDNDGEGVGGREGVAYTYSVFFLYISFQYRDCSKRNQVRTIRSNAMADTNM